MVGKINSVSGFLKAKIAAETTVETSTEASAEASAKIKGDFSLEALKNKATSVIKDASEEASSGISSFVESKMKDITSADNSMSMGFNSNTSFGLMGDDDFDYTKYCEHNWSNSYESEDACLADKMTQ